MEYTWVPASLLPPLLPWLAIFGLLLLRRNRALSAWWIWVPLLAGMCLDPALRAVLNFLPQQALDLLVQTCRAVFFATAAVWLTAGYLEWKPRFLSFLGALGSAAGFGVFSLITTEWQDWSGQTIFTAIPVVVACVDLAGALTLAGWFCHRRYGPLRLFLAVLISTLILSIASAAVFLALVWVLTRGQVMLDQFLVAMLVLAGLCVGALVPFLLLSFATRFYRERIKDFLHLGLLEPPPVIIPAAEPMAEMAK